ncbi:SDR family NAD(P)-dependent oxidoreductase [Halomonas sp. PA16-9]|uniref:SDR family NAD(P)-dependent oxidoreductase n=1 Tax=Halomonas sp. PA16-9 TaxID=2576841 RepID=UPI0030EED0CD
MSPSLHSRCVLITGAHRAIGGALANAYADPSTHLVLHGRQQEKLEALATTCRQKGAQVTLSTINLTDDHALKSWLAEVCAQQVPNILIANAGKNTHPQGPDILEPWADVQALLDINLKTPIAMVQHLVPAMQTRGSGQLVLISSLAAWHGLPTTPSYSASKAGSLWRRAARATRASRYRRHCGHARLCYLTDVRGHARPQTLGVAARARGQGH